MIECIINNPFLKYNPLFIILSFVLISIMIILFSILLTNYADALSERKKIDGGLIGFILLAAISSLPELVVSISSVINLPHSIGCNLAIGNVLGSNLFNLSIIALISIMFTKKLITMNNKNLFLKITTQTILMTLLVFLLLNFNHVHGKYLIILIPIIYILFICFNKNYSFEENKNKKINKLIKKKSLVFYSKFILISFIVVILGVLMSSIGNIMSLDISNGGLGLNANFTGTLFLALSTSLPELAIALSCIKMNNTQMACGNIFGSNLFNFLIIFLSDLFIKKNSIFEYTIWSNNISVISILLLSLSMLVIFKLKNEKFVKIFGIKMIIIYLLTLSNI